MTPVTYHMTAHSPILNMEKLGIVFKGVSKMKLKVYVCYRVREIIRGNQLF